MKDKRVSITTIDNPFNPINDFERWYSYDKAKGYNTCEYLARIVRDSDSLSEADVQAELERAIDEIIEFNPLKLWKKVIA